MERDDGNSLVKAYIQQGRGLESAINLYNDTADQYDKMLEATDFRGPEILTTAVGKLLGEVRDVEILDVGAGTGLSGLALRQAGFLHIDALDGSQGMLDEAEKKSVYRRCYCKLLFGNKDHNIPRRYDIVTLSGAFQVNHLTKAVYRDLISFVKSGGFIVNVMRDGVQYDPYFGDGLEPFLKSLEEEGLLEQVSRDIVPGYIGAGSGGGSNAVVYSHRVL